MTAEQFYRTVYGPVVAAFAEMEVAGIKIDVGHGETLAKDLQGRCETLEREAAAIAARYGVANFKPTQKEVAGKLLYGKLGFEPTHRTAVKGIPAVHAAALSKLAGRHPFVDLLIEHARVNKVLSTNVEPFIRPWGKQGWLWPDGKIHAEFHLDLTRSGRSSTDNPNIQNIPKRDKELATKVRRMMVPSHKGGGIGERDQKAFELRVSAMYTGDRAFIDVFKRNGNPHREFAAEVLKVAQERVTDRQYGAFKGADFQLIFGGSWRGLQASLSDKYGIVLSDDEAQLIHTGFFRLHPETAAYLERQKQAVLERGMVVSLTGRRRAIHPPLPGVRGYEREHPFHVAANTPIQGTAWDLMLGAILKFWRATKKHRLRSRQINAVHDNGVWDIFPGEERAVMGLAHECMTQLGDLFDFITVPLDTEGMLGPTWGTMSVYV